MNLQDILVTGGAAAALTLGLILIYAILVLLIPIFLLGIYRQAEETNRLLTVLVKRTRTGEENAAVARLDCLVAHAEHRDGVTFRDPT